MYKISLLPEKYRLERLKAAQRLDLVIYFLFFTVICLILLALSTFVRLNRTLELESLDAEIGKLEAEIASLSEYAEKKDVVESVYRNIASLADGLPSMPRVIPQILETVPMSISIDNVSVGYNANSKTTTMEITGDAIDYSDVAGWIKALDELELTGEIYHSYSQGMPDNSSYNVSFELTVEVLDKSAVDDIVWDLGD
ncbi:MAG TPA: hypothetical protein PK778_09025 [Bacillota bacterium]|nr:hypothetical protein [Clostridiales bacterium]HPT86118.1 hypothetical protein [Bacillota bacterium]